VEPETIALRTALRGRVLSTSVVGAVELMLAARRKEGAAGVDQAERVVASLNLVALTLELARDASRLVTLRSLDAVHLATALSLRETVDAFVVYDHRLANEARAQGLEVLTPA